MRTVYCFLLLLIALAAVLVSFKKDLPAAEYISLYDQQFIRFRNSQSALLHLILEKDCATPEAKQQIKAAIWQARNDMKAADFWMRYLEPTVYKQINGPLPVEWETEVFEKFEKPYQRPGAGLTLAELYLDEDIINKDSLAGMVQKGLSATNAFSQDSVTKRIKTFQHFYLCNRLFLLNLAAIYTTGFECPDTSRIIPELREQLNSTLAIYEAFNKGFPGTRLSDNYQQLFNKLQLFVNAQPANYSNFDHFTFIKDYVNPLFALNQAAISNYNVVSNSFVDYTLNRTANSIFSKDLYTGQNPKGIFLRVTDEKALSAIRHAGKLLFYDPLLSANNMRSCASCHKAATYFTDTATATSLQYNRVDFLERNTPSLINAEYNHLLMLDGKHISLQNQAMEVLMNPKELASREDIILKKMLSCPDYKKMFESFLTYTPQETDITLEHITSAISLYYSQFSRYYSPFDDAINQNTALTPSEKSGFNLFMSKAQCATCHFVPQFNGVKPPYVGSEFEVLGVPADTGFTRLSADSGRYIINPARETAGAFRTGSVRNASFTKPYMHNGVFTSLRQVINFYDAGGGAGRGLPVTNQTLSADSLHLNELEKDDLIAFIGSINEKILFEEPPITLPASKDRALNKRKPGGIY